MYKDKKGYIDIKVTEKITPRAPACLLSLNNSLPKKKAIIPAKKRQMKDATCTICILGNILYKALRKYCVGSNFAGNDTMPAMVDA